MIVYIDGVFDLFHYGHLESFKKCKELFSDVFLIVGIISDKNSENYKKKPIINEKHRYEIIKNIKIVDLVVEDAPLIINKNFINKYNIDYIAHGFSNKTDFENQKHFFEYPIMINKFKVIQYCNEISTTKIIKHIKENY